jgi:hypothetical protein
MRIQRRSAGEGATTTIVACRLILFTKHPNPLALVQLHDTETADSAITNKSSAWSVLLVHKTLVIINYM